MWKWVYRYRERNFPNDPLRLPEQPYNRKTTAQVCHLFLSSTMFSPISRMYSCLLPLLFLFLFLLWQDKGGTQKKKVTPSARRPLPTPVFPTIFPPVSRLPFFSHATHFFPSQTPPLFLPPDNGKLLADIFSVRL